MFNPFSSVILKGSGAYKLKPLLFTDEWMH